MKVALAVIYGRPGDLAAELTEPTRGYLYYLKIFINLFSSVREWSLNGTAPGVFGIGSDRPLGI